MAVYSASTTMEWVSETVEGVSEMMNVHSTELVEMRGNINSNSLTSTLLTSILSLQHIHFKSLTPTLLLQLYHFNTFTSGNIKTLSAHADAANATVQMLMEIQKHMDFLDESVHTLNREKEEGEREETITLLDLEQMRTEVNLSYHHRNK